jgi:hypothetical protein
MEVVAAHWHETNIIALHPLGTTVRYVRNNAYLITISRGPPPQTKRCFHIKLFGLATGCIIKEQADSIDEGGRGTCDGGAGKGQLANSTPTI